MNKKAMNKKINSVAKAAKKNHAATVAVVAGAGLSVLGNIVIGSMTIIKAVKNHKVDPVPDPQPIPDPTNNGNNSNNNNGNNNPPEGGTQDNQQDNQQNPENK